MTRKAEEITFAGIVLLLLFSCYAIVMSIVNFDPAPAHQAECRTSGHAIVECDDE
jgi:hypothetical protein